MRRLAVPCAIVLWLAGCGGDDDEEPVRSTTVNPNSTLRVTAKEYSFDPGRVVVRGAGPLTIRLRNAGDLAHDLRLRRGGEEIGGTPVLPAGQTGSARVNLEHGNYEMFCSVGDHAELGMTGEFQVK
jgi:plastocyanin